MENLIIDFLKDIVDIDFNMGFKKWVRVLAVISFLAGAGSATGLYILINLS